MESEGTERPDSPKKKLKASSSTHGDIILPDCSASNSNKRIPESLHEDIPETNGLAPTRKNRSSVTSSEADLERSRHESYVDASSIQEEIVSSSENIVTTIEDRLSRNEGGADSASKECESEIVSSNGPENKNESSV